MKESSSTVLQGLEALFPQPHTSQGCLLWLRFHGWTLHLKH